MLGALCYLCSAWKNYRGSETSGTTFELLACFELRLGWTEIAIRSAILMLIAKICKIQNDEFRRNLT